MPKDVSLTILSNLGHLTFSLFLNISLKSKNTAIDKDAVKIPE